MNTNKKYFSVSLAFLFGAGLAVLPVSALAAPQFLVSWQAQSFVPNWYQGKIFPTNGTSVLVDFELVDGGRIVDLSKTIVRWYINNKLIKNEKDGLGIQSLSFTTPDYGGSLTGLRIALPAYKGVFVDTLVQIPVEAPAAVINGRLGASQIQIGDNWLEVAPFFFNVKNTDDLIFDWTANGETAAVSTSTPWRLNLNIDPRTPPGFNVNLQVAVRSVLNQLESASKSVLLQVK